MNHQNGCATWKNTKQWQVMKVVSGKYLPLRSLIIQIRSVVWQWHLTKDDYFCILAAANKTNLISKAFKNGTESILKFAKTSIAV